MSDNKLKNMNPASLARPSDLIPSQSVAAPRGGGGTDLLVSHTHGRARDLPSPMGMRLHGGETVELLEDQVFSDKVVIPAGEKGRAMHPSSQAAAWVVLFPRVGKKLRVIPEPLLQIV
ncbi:MAG: hypothetical protein JKY65_09360 [Planctomycetes bacterium]|nr:hypothetical protein [Planctomycetota bacterium]